MRGRRSPAAPDRRVGGPASGHREGERSPAARAGLALCLILSAAAPAHPDSPAAEPADGGAGTAALVAALRARILAAPSATAALEAWCGEHGLAERGQLVARRQPAADKPLTVEQRTRLGIAPDEPVRYRRVRLACGDRVMSEADNWYVPARLTPAMNAALDATEAPFGRVVRALAPVRRTLDMRPFPTPDQPGPDTPLFAVEAVLTTATGEPFCEVAEVYLGGALPDAR